MKPAEQCSDESLKMILSSTSNDTVAQRTVAHVEVCHHCQQRIEELAAEEQLWNDVKEILTTCPNSQNANKDSSTTPRWSGKFYSKQMVLSDSLIKQMLAPPSHPEMLGRIGRYEVERIIGIGGMGVVFKAFDTELNRPVAVKVLALHLAGHGAARKRFAREARAAAAIVHEHVVAIHNVETELECPFLVMQFVPGDSLQQRIDREGALELAEILRIAMQTAAGLAAAHAQGLVHRDVKPSNILLEQNLDRALLTDFGLARASDDASLTHTGYHPGTPQYMSPEQARGESVGVRSDLFSLGSVIYTMCTGRPPFRAETAYGILRRITDEQPHSIRDLNPSIPVWLEHVVFKLLSKSPEDRYESADAVRSLLEACLAHVHQPTVVGLPDPLNQLSFPSVDRQRNWTMLAVAMALLILASGIMYGVFSKTNRGHESIVGKNGLMGVNSQTNPNGSTSASTSKHQWDAVDEPITTLNERISSLEVELDSAGWPAR